MSDQAYWERHAQRYDSSLRLLGRPLPRMLELTSRAVAGCRRVLEVAAGTGLVTTAIGKVAGEVIATDYAAAMVSLLQQRVRDQGLANVRCEQADIHALPYESGAFDAVVAANVLHLVPDFPKAIASLRRVLRPDGKLVTPTFCHDETALSWMVSRALALTGFPGQRRFTVGTLEAALAKEGLRVTHVETLPGLIPIGYVEGHLSGAGAS
ncbi:MAG: class I SAM-dependent methyltransferase [Deltaproteobacteria bacterium]|nr:class I SAM-dependent methyltransferase [Deltaproteobacteria bacterium]